jgi:signal transduction histidine kinase/CheY-like chemotaxis protein/ligand-binding sensor domain-containing protein
MNSFRGKFGEVNRGALRRKRGIILACLLPLMLWGQSKESSLERYYPFHLETFTKEDGLGQLLGYCLTQDSLGFVWIGGEEGLNRYQGLDFKYYPPTEAYEGGSGLPNDDVFAIAEERSGHFWLGYRQSGLVLFDVQKETLTRYRSSGKDPHGLSNDRVRSLLRSPVGIWVGTDQGLNLIVRAEKEIRFRHFLRQEQINCLSLLDSQSLLVGTPSGLFVVSLENFETSPRQLVGSSSHPKDISAIVVQKEQTVFLAIEEEGIFQYNRDFERGAPILPCPYVSFNDLEYGLGNRLWVAGDWGFGYWEKETGDWYEFPGQMTGRVFDLFLDRFDNLFVANVLNLSRISLAGKGMIRIPAELQSDFILARNFLDGQTNREILTVTESEVFAVSIDHGPDRHTVSRNPVPELAVIKGGFCLTEEPGRGLWIGTREQGLALWDGQAVSFFFAEDPRLAGERVSEIMLDQNQRFWIGSWGHGFFEALRDSEGLPMALVQYTHDPDDSLSLPHNGLRCVIEDRQGRIWIGTQGGGMAQFHPQSGHFTRYLQINPFTGQEGVIEVIHILSDPNDESLWLGTSLGLLHFFPDRPEEQQWERISVPEAFSSKMVFNIAFDQRVRIWMGLYGGKRVYDPVQEEVMRFPVLPFWTGYGHGAYVDHEGWVYHGGGKGFLAFHPDSFDTNMEAPDIYLTSLKVFGEEVGIEKKEVTSGFQLRKSVPFLEELRLPYDQNLIELGFAGLGKGNPADFRYQYQIEGLSSNWAPLPPGQQSLYLNGLQPGRYTLNLRASNPFGRWNEKVHSWPLRILPPWYRTWWAWSLYFLLFSGILWWFFRNYQTRQRLHQKLAMEAFEKARLQEVDEIKNRFFTNITHEFRTPLTLMLGPALQLLEQSTSASERDKLSIIQRNAKRLLHLINQILDLNRLESEEIVLQEEVQDLAQYLRLLLGSFDSLAEAREIDFVVKLPDLALWLLFDKDKLEKVIVNLLSNAFKFTPAGGKVEFELASEPWAGEKEKVTLTVSDTGAGIPTEALPHIFDRFYQVDHSSTRQHEGSGIGLALTHQLVQAMKGEIAVESEVNQGTRFALCFTLARGNPDSQTRTLPPAVPVPTIKPPQSPIPAAMVPDDQGPLVLLVEDNTDMRAFIQSCLAKPYQIAEAVNGKEGLQIALQTVPDLIISDVMMPEMDGFEFTRLVKEKEITSHIPVVLLTARAGVDSKVTGYATGADAYLTKPFEPKELLALVQNQIAQRRKLKEKYTQLALLPAPSQNLRSPDEQFLQKVQQALETHHADPALTAEAFAEKIHLSRMQLHRKLKALLDKPTSELIRDFRLERAKSLLQSQSLSVTEVAFQTGYEDPSYFARLFKKEVGISPSEYVGGKI